MFFVNKKQNIEILKIALVQRPHWRFFSKIMDVLHPMIQLVRHKLVNILKFMKKNNKEITKEIVKEVMQLFYSNKLIKSQLYNKIDKAVQNDSFRFQMLGDPASELLEVLLWVLLIFDKSFGETCVRTKLYIVAHIKSINVLSKILQLLFKFEFLKFTDFIELNQLPILAEYYFTILQYIMPLEIHPYVSILAHTIVFKQILWVNDKKLNPLKRGMIIFL